MMKKATITKTVDLLDGGCNVCGIIENENYILTIDEQEIPLEELTVNALITAIVLKNGYKRKYETDVIDDYILYIKEGHQVRLKEEYNFLIYSSDTAKVETQDQIVDEKQLVEKVNEILETLFKLEELEFCF
ncbi:hypothetical protein A5819_002067 [Enterococcus sp. 7E2_DIV0204]|uniref:DUF4809 domain-containing protein n=1 Tax=Candidatus Enterococcus lemimoniae TaxID=1834167 RepID=A0ABZ2T4M6_9ENTE|nr:MULTISPECIES: DUF4809 family protein [unclassified Enterococcus]OTN89569.1 hypothetical protein A5819_002067 [Enterococcus sp. 7E2_DIV0204]OTO68418.1 hypothetical protein A5866_000616 [Enterococcus sp. 12C11_DIV0727]OTP52025.1 hypothetical protein A5884_001226 [Enterococcus sp. 7D2_DIV0200]